MADDTSNGNWHRLECRVIYGDTDCAGVVYYGNYLRYFEAGRSELLRDYGVPNLELEEKGYILPVVECKIRYKASARYDDLLLVETSVQEVKKMSCRFNYRISRVADQQLLAKGYTVHACVDRQGKLIRFPDYFLAKLRIFAGE